MQPNINLPEGLTPDMLAAIMQYMTAQQQALQFQERPSGTLEAKQVRGVNPRYQYQFREFPKALLPPVVTVLSEEEERTFRVSQRQPLPWDNREMAALYYGKRAYPARMQPTQIVVNSKHEESVKLAEWNMQGDERIAYPRWLFHPTSAPKMVNSLGEEEALGKHWYPTVKEATDEAIRMNGQQEAQKLRVTLITRANELGIKHDPSWNNGRFEEAIAKAEKKAA